MPGRWKTGGCSMASTQASSGPPRRPCATTTTGSTLSPHPTASGCACPLTSTSPTAAASAASRSTAASVHSARTVEPASSPPVTRDASQRKLPTAMTAPAAAPSAPSSPPSHAAGPATAAPSTHASRDTRDVRSLGVIDLPSGFADRSKEHHEPRGDPEAEPDQQEPRLGAEPQVGVVAADEANHGREHHRDADRGQLGERGPGRFLPGRRHVTRNTTTAPGACEEIAHARAAPSSMERCTSSSDAYEPRTVYGSRRTASTIGRMIHRLVSGTPSHGSSTWKARMYAMPMAVPGTARISVLSPSSVSRPGSRVRARIHAIGTPTAMQITTARTEYSRLFTMYFGVSTITRSKKSHV